MISETSDSNGQHRLDAFIARATSANDQAAQSILDNASSLKQSRSYLSGANNDNAQRRAVDLCRTVGEEMAATGDVATPDQLKRWRELLLDYGR